MRLQVLLAGLLVVLPLTVSAQQPSATDVTFAEALNTAAIRAIDIQAFGTGIERYVLQEAARKLRAGQQATVTITFTVVPVTKPTVQLPPKPTFDPGIDTCYQICPEGAGQTFLQCYLNCTSPVRLRLKP